MTRLIFGNLALLWSVSGRNASSKTRRTGGLSRLSMMRAGAEAAEAVGREGPDCVPFKSYHQALCARGPPSWHEEKVMD